MYIRFIDNIKDFLYRKPIWFVQRSIRGYSDRDLWSVNARLLEIIINHLNAFIKVTNGYPANYASFDDYIAMIKSIITDLEYCLWVLDEKFYNDEEDIDKLVKLHKFHYKELKKVKRRAFRNLSDELEGLWW